MGSESAEFLERLALLRRLPAADRVSALVSLLDTVAEHERAPVVVELLEVASAGHGLDQGRGPVSAVARRLTEGSRRSSETALVQLVRRWELIPDELRGAARSVGAKRWVRYAAALADDPDPRARRSLVSLCAETGDAELAGSLVGLLTDIDPGIASSADRVLLALAFTAAGLDPESGEACPASARAMGAPERAMVEDAVTRAAVAVSEHRRRGPMLAAMALLDPASLWRDRASSGSALSKWFRLGDAGSHAALKAALRLSPHPLARARAMEWLAVAPFAGACLERLAWAGSAAEHAAVLSRAHTLLNPARVRLAASIEAGASRPRGSTGAGGRVGAFPDGTRLGALTAQIRRALPRLVAALNPGVEQRRGLLEPLLADTDPVARLASARNATEAGRLDLCFDADPYVARSAFLSWSLVGVRGPGGAYESRLGLRDEPGHRRILGRLARSAHPCVRGLAAQEAESLTLAVPSSPAGLVAARWMLARDPAAFETRLRTAVRGPDSSQRVLAVQLLRRMGLCAHFEPELLALVESAGEAGGRVAATAVAALGELQTPASIAVVHARLNDPDVRVRANAVEALARQSRSGKDLASADPAAYGVLIELKADADHRVRANALRALLGRPPDMIEAKPGVGASRIYEPAAVDALADMLGDERPAHRLAGAWLAGRVLPYHGRTRLGKRFAGLAARVGELAAKDQDPGVRRRALWCAETLHAELRVEWAAQAKKREPVASGAAE